MTARALVAKAAPAFRRCNYFSSPLFWDRTLGHRKALAFAEKWLAINEALPLDALQALRWPRLKRTIEHAVTNVPLYADLYRGVSLGSLKDENDLRLLPRIKKDDFRRYAAGRRNTAGNVPAWRSETAQTSGSTGAPFRFFLDHAYRAEKIAMGNRIWRWAGADPYAKKLLCAPESARGYYPNLVFLHPHFIRARKKEYIETIRASGTKLIFGSPLMAFDLLWAIAEEGSGGGDLRFEKAVLGGHAVAPGIRKFLKERFGCETFEFYASGEVRMIGIECEAHNGLHLQEENMVVEIADEEGAPLPPGRAGKILVTSFSNDAMPFIRYELGDRGMMLAGACPCGRTSRRVFVEGRTGEALLVTPSGESVSPAVLRDTLDRYFDYFHRYQVVQKESDALLLRIVPTARHKPVVERRAVLELQKSIGSPVAIAIERVRDIPPLPGGKFQYFVSPLWSKKFPEGMLAVSNGSPSPRETS